MTISYYSNLQDFMNSFSPDNLIKQTTCFKSVLPTFTDLIMTNQKYLFMKSCTFESG